VGLRPPHCLGGQGQGNGDCLGRRAGLPAVAGLPAAAGLRAHLPVWLSWRTDSAWERVCPGASGLAGAHTWREKRGGGAVSGRRRLKGGGAGSTTVAGQATTKGQGQGRGSTTRSQGLRDQRPRVQKGQMQKQAAAPHLERVVERHGQQPPAAVGRPRRALGALRVPHLAHWGGPLLLAAPQPARVPHPHGAVAAARRQQVAAAAAAVAVQQVEGVDLPIVQGDRRCDRARRSNINDCPLPLGRGEPQGVAAGVPLGRGPLGAVGGGRQAGGEQELAWAVWVQGEGGWLMSGRRVGVRGGSCC
jgi:hypothetical protein